MLPSPAVRFVALRDRREIGFGDIAGEERRLRSEEKEFARDDFFFVDNSSGDRRFSGVEMRQEFVDHGDFRLRCFQPARTSFCKRSCRFCSDARSARTSSVLITSMSRTGSIVPLT